MGAEHVPGHQQAVGDVVALVAAVDALHPDRHGHELVDLAEDVVLAVGLHRGQVAAQRGRSSAIAPSRRAARSPRVASSTECR